MKTEKYDVRVIHEPRDEDEKNYWAYFAPNGYVAVRSIAPTKALARQFICSCEFNSDNDNYLSYEAKGWLLKKIEFTIKVKK